MSDVDSFERQNYLYERHEGDGALVEVSHFQVMKFAAIITAALDGHVFYADTSRTVSRFLQVSAWKWG